MKRFICSFALVLPNVLMAQSPSKVCVFDAETKKPIENAYVRGKYDWGMTNDKGCVELKKEDTVLVIRIGYKTVKGPFKDTIYLVPSPLTLKEIEVSAVKIGAIAHLPFSVEVTDRELKVDEVNIQGFGTAYAKPIVRGFDIKRLSIIRDGFVVSDLSDEHDHPLHLIYPDVEDLNIIKGSAGAVFGGGFGGLIYSKSSSAKYDTLFHNVDVLFNNNGRKFKGEYMLNYGNNALSSLATISGEYSNDYASANELIPNSFNREIYTSLNLRWKFLGLDPSLYVRYNFKRWGIPFESSVSNNTYSDITFTLSGFGVNYQRTKQVEIEDEHEHELHHGNHGEISTEILLETYQMKYEYKYKQYQGILRILMERMVENRLEGFASIYGPLYTSERFQILGGLGVNALKDKYNFSAIIGGSYGMPFGNLGLSFSRSFRFPTLYELYFEGVHHGVGRYDIGNPNLKEEVSYEVQASAKLMKGNMIFNIQTFGMRVYDYIGLMYVGNYIDEEGDTIGKYTWVNTNALFYGYNLGGSYVIKNSTLTLSYSEMRAIFENSEVVDYLPTPEFRFSLSMNFGMFSPQGFVRYIPSKGKIVGDLNLIVGKGDTRLTMGIFNLMNADWIETVDPLKTPIPGRSVYIRFSKYIH